MMTPERSTNGGDDGGDDLPVLDIGDLEDQQTTSSPAADTTLDTNTVITNTMMTGIANLNNSINTSVSSENCKIINESDQQPPYSPCPDPEGAVSPLVDVSINEDDIVPPSANLTPVKLENNLKEQDTFTSSPTGSHEDDERMPGDEEGDDEIRPLSRRKQRMRIVKCYGLVAVIVLVCAIGIPLGAVMIFKNKNNEASFAGASESLNSPSTTYDSNEPIYEEEAETYEDVMSDPPDAFDTTDPPAVVEEEYVPEAVPEEDVDTDSPQVWEDEFDGTDAPIEIVPVDNPFGERNVTSDINTDTWAPTWMPTEGGTAPTWMPTEAGTSPTWMPTEAGTAPTWMPTEAGTAPTWMPTQTGSGPTWAPSEGGTSPTWLPTSAPTFGIGAAPSSIPESATVPTSSPTGAGTTTVPTTTAVPPTAAPTQGQTAPTTPGPDRSDIYFDLINVTSPAILQDTRSPQALSYLWLVEKDQILPVPSGRSLIQRYILVVMDHVMHDPIRPVFSQPTKDHCEWTGIVCNATTGDVTEINWRLQEMNGRLVEEIKHMDSLEWLDLSENELVGSIAPLYEAKSLKHVFLHNNQFSGTLSEQIGLLENLESLYLGHNQLSGNIPLSLRSSRGVAKPLKWLILSHNKFSGYLPPSWRMRNLYYLDLGYNNLSGPLPSDWDINMVRLRHLYLDHNEFTGTVPSYFGQLGNGRLKQLHLSDNFLSGEVPFNWNPMDQMTSMTFHNNNITRPVHPRVCGLSVFEEGNMVEFRVDCPICTCDFLCEMCVGEDSQK